MALVNIQQMLDNVITPKITETVFNKDYDEFESYFAKDTLQSGGKQIVDTQRVSTDSVARNYTRDDVNGEGGSYVTVDAKWNKLYQDVTFEVGGIDLSEMANGGTPQMRNAIEDAAALAMLDLKQVWWSNLYSRLSADIDDTVAYSDASLSRSTYPTLASVVDDTDTSVTLALLRAQKNAMRLNKNCGPDSGYMWMMESSVYNKFQPLAAAEHTWNVTGSTGVPIAAGYQPIGTWDGVGVINPQGMTTGDGFLIRPQDVLIRKNRPLWIKAVESNRDSTKMIMGAGVTSRVVQPGLNSKFENKD